MLKNPFNIFWREPPQKDKEGVSLCIQVNVSASGLIPPGAYNIKVEGNQIYWNLGESQ